MEKTYKVIVAIRATSYRLSPADQGYHADFLDAGGEIVASLDNVVFVDLMPGASQQGAQVEKLTEWESGQTPCIWTQEDDEGQNLWESSCGDSFFLESDTPKENHIKFCCFCGHPIIEKLYEPTEDEDEYQN